jgi:hypothetical protein
MADLKIADWEYLHAEQFVSVYLEHLIAAAASFSTVMGNVRAHAAVLDGAEGIASACEAFSQSAVAISTRWIAASGGIAGQADSFVAKIDEFDQFVY